MFGREPKVNPGSVRTKMQPQMQSTLFSTMEPHLLRQALLLKAPSDINALGETIPRVQQVCEDETFWKQYMKERYYLTMDLPATTTARNSSYGMYRDCAAVTEDILREMFAVEVYPTTRLTLLYQLAWRDARVGLERDVSRCDPDRSPSCRAPWTRHITFQGKEKMVGRTAETCRVRVSVMG